MMDTSQRRPYIDVHAHIGDLVSRAPAVRQDAAKFLARMSQSSLVAAIISPASGGPQARGTVDTEEQNNVVAELCHRFPVGLAIVEVRHEQAAADEIGGAIVTLGLSGLMCHPKFSGHELGTEIYPALEVVDAHGGMALIHLIDDESGDRVAGYAQRFPQTTFIMAHASMRPAQHNAVIRAAVGVDNVFLDIAQKPVGDPSWDLADLVQRVGAERVLFGSDAPYYDYRLLQDQIEEAALSEAVKDRIAWRNTAELVRRVRPGWMPDMTPVDGNGFGEGEDLWAGMKGRTPTR